MENYLMCVVVHVAFRMGMVVICAVGFVGVDVIVLVCAFMRV
ncbi:hypothetical protein [Maridesulfovibrio sp. FT414]